LVALATRDPGGKSLREKIFEPKGPDEANKDDAEGMNARNKRNEIWPHENPSEVAPTIIRQRHIVLPIDRRFHSLGSCNQELPSFRLEAHTVGVTLSWEPAMVLQKAAVS
jgi:hypothetical protein